MDYPYREYYVSYLLNVRELSSTSVHHYLDAINWISRYLVGKKLLKKSLFEVSSIEVLEQLAQALLSDEAFVSMNRRGHQMYTAGLNNYLRFARGEEFETIGSKARILDMPMEVPSQSERRGQQIWSRSEIIKIQAIKIANFECEINTDHKTFIAARNGMPYMEGHHALPINAQDQFRVSLDVYANIICLCPVCHRKIHYGLRDDRVSMVRHIYDQRVSRLANSGIEISKEDFVEMAVGT